MDCETAGAEGRRYVAQEFISIGNKPGSGPFIMVGSPCPQCGAPLADPERDTLVICGFEADQLTFTCEQMWVCKIRRCREDVRRLGRGVGKVTTMCPNIAPIAISCLLTGFALGFAMRNLLQPKGPDAQRTKPYPPLSSETAERFKRDIDARVRSV